MRVEQTNREQRATRPVYTSVRFVAMFRYVCLNALLIIVSGAEDLRICAEVGLSESEECQFTVCTFCISI